MSDRSFLEDAALKAAFEATILSYHILKNRPDLSKEEKLNGLYLTYEFLNGLMDELETCIDEVKQL